MRKDMKLVGLDTDRDAKLESGILIEESQRRLGYVRELKKGDIEDSSRRRNAEMVALGIVAAAILASACEPIDTGRIIANHENTPTISEVTTEFLINTPTFRVEPTLVYTATLSPEEKNKINTATSVAATQEMISEISSAVIKLGLNPNRKYSLIDDYLVDKYNLAKMARWEKGSWIETSLEEKYGHLVGEGEFTHPIMDYGNNFFDGDGHSDGVDTRYESVVFGAKATGDCWVKNEEIPGLNVATDVLYCDFVFRLKDVGLKKVTVRVDVIDPNDEINMELVLPSGEDVFITTESAQTEAKYFQPGQGVLIEFAHKRPDFMPLPSTRFYNKWWGLSNMRNRANYVYWTEHKLELTDLAGDFLKGSQELPEIINLIPAQFVFLLWPINESLPINQPDWND